MIPQFPDFKPIEASDREEVEAFVRRFPPYSDFNFVSLLCYDVCGAFGLAYLNGNLVVRMRDYVTQEPLFSFIGTQNAPATASAILCLIRKTGGRPVLRLLPEEVASAMNGTAGTDFTVNADESSFDYVHSVADLTGLPSPQLRRKRREIERFRKRYLDHEVSVLDLDAPQTLAGIRAVVVAWKEEKRRSEEEIAVEFAAIERCLTHGVAFGLVAVGAFVEGALAGFTINETVHDGFYMAHFGKALPLHRGLCDLIEHETAKVMQGLGCTHMNYQQDLGLDGLRSAKRAWRPAAYLRKFTLEAA